MGLERFFFFTQTDGVRLGETTEQFNARVAEIEQLETACKDGRFRPDEYESAQRRLRDLKAPFDFDADDEGY